MPDKGQLTVAEVSFWNAEAKSCDERQQRELIKGNNYPFLVNYYEGIERSDAFYPHVATQQMYAIINEYFPNTNSLISEIMYQNPDILVEATNPMAEEDLPLMKAALKYGWDKTNALIENRVALFDMLYAGYCAVEVDILPELKNRNQPEAEQPQEEEPKSIFNKIADKFKEITNTDEAEKNLAVLSPSMESNFATAQGTYIRRYDPLDVPLDWRAENVRDRRYNLKRVWLSKAEFDVRYPEFRNRVSAEEKGFDYSQHKLQIHNRKVMLYEFQIRLNKNQYKTIIVSPSVNTREIDMFIRPYDTNGFNMKIGTLHKYGKLYSKSFAQVNKKMQDEMNHYVRHLMNVTERNIPKYISDKNKVLEDGKESLRSANINDIIEIDGNPSNAIVPLQPTIISFENKELLGIFQDQKNKLWSVSESRISGKTQAKFATDLAIQEAGFQAKQIDVQVGLRMLIQEQLDTMKDIIAKFWDDAVFLKLTGHSKMDWYVPQTVPNPNNPEQQIVINPLAEILTADYDVKVDIASALRPNRKDQLNNMFFFMTQLVTIRPVLQSQGKDINIEEIQKISKEFGWNPDKIFIDYQPQTQLSVPASTGETISPEENARRQAEAEARVGQTG